MLLSTAPRDFYLSHKINVILCTTTRRIYSPTLTFYSSCIMYALSCFGLRSAVLVASVAADLALCP